MIPELANRPQVSREQLGELEHETSAGTRDAALDTQERAISERHTIQDGGPADPANGRRVWLAAAVIATVVALAIGGYLLISTLTAPQPKSAPGNRPQDIHALTRPQLHAMNMKLGARLQKYPADGEAWLMVARSLTALGRFKEASAAFGRATNVLPENAQMLADYAEALALAQDQHLVGEAENIVNRALAADPRNIKALALSGSAAFEHQDYPRAISAWRKVLDIVPGDSRVADRLRAGIAEAEARSGKRSSQ